MCRASMVQTWPSDLFTYWCRGCAVLWLVHASTTSGCKPTLPSHRSRDSSLAMHPALWSERWLVSMLWATQRLRSLLRLLWSSLRPRWQWCRGAAILQFWWQHSRFRDSRLPWLQPVSHTQGGTCIHLFHLFMHHPVDHWFCYWIVY